MTSSGMLRSVAPVRTDITEELGASIIRVTRIGELETALPVTGNRCIGCQLRATFLHFIILIIFTREKNKELLVTSSFSCHFGLLRFK
jgi:hypothetical protein